MREADRKKLEQREEWTDDELRQGALDVLYKLGYDVAQLSSNLSDVIVKLRQATELLMHIERRQRRSATTGGQQCQKQAAGRASTASTKDVTAEQVGTA